MKCPSCADVLLTMSERQGVEIDYCPQCRGVWLDRGELDKIIAKSLAETASTQPAPSSYSAPKYKDDYHGHKDGYRHKRKKSFLEDLFD